MGWFTNSSAAKKEPPADIWQVCPSCQAHVFKDEWAANMKVCPKCNFHDRLGCRERVGLLVDAGSFREFNQHIVPSDPLDFSDAKEPYKTKAAETVRKLGISESVITGSGSIAGRRVVLAVMDFRFLGGSLASGTGEKIVLAIEHALRFKRAFIMVSASGGARCGEQDQQRCEDGRAARDGVEAMLHGVAPQMKRAEILLAQGRFIRTRSRESSSHARIRRFAGSPGTTGSRLRLFAGSRLGGTDGNVGIQNA